MWKPGGQATGKRKWMGIENPKVSHSEHFVYATQMELLGLLIGLGSVWLFDIGRRNGEDMAHLE